MIIDATRGRIPTTARIFEIADELALLAVDADDGQMTALETVAQLDQMAERLLHFGVQGIGQFMGVIAVGRLVDEGL